MSQIPVPPGPPPAIVVNKTEYMEAQRVIAEEGAITMQQKVNLDLHIMLNFKQTFKNLFNYYLKKRKYSITVTDLIPNLADGVLLFTLIECLSGEKITEKYYKIPKDEKQKLENMSKALSYLETKQIRSKGITPQGILSMSSSSLCQIF